MYDWPEVAAATDALWAAIRDRLRAEGVAAPEALDRGRGLVEGWTDPGLVLGQTCGLPLVRTLAGRVAVVGALDYGLPGCPPGLVPERGDRAGGRPARRPRRLPRRDAGDQRHGLPVGLGRDPPPRRAPRDGRALLRRGPRRRAPTATSVRAVAAGAADLAAIDMVSWGLARRFVPEARRLRVLFATDPTPGLPLIAAKGTDVAPHRRAVAAAVAGLDPATRAALGIRGFVALGAEAWAIVGQRLAAAGARLRDAPDAGR